MNRQEQLTKLEQEKEFDIIIIGGGATGLGCAVESSSRGYKTLLLERKDFAKGTSSRSTKLVHGGVRYLVQGNTRLVKEALLERGRLLRNAPHVCHTLSFIVPAYKWWQKWYYGIGLHIYEFLSGKLSLGRTAQLSRKKILSILPDLSATHLTGGMQYFDGQFDDSRLAINLAQTAIEQGAVVINYCGVIDFIREGKSITGVIAKDEIDGKQFILKAKAVINSTGVFADELLQMAEGHSEKTIIPSQGIHLVVERKFFKGDSALMIPKTDDGRVLFVIPWHDKLLLGTTDTPVERIVEEPKPLKEEIDFIIGHFNRYSEQKISCRDIKSVFVGLRPLANIGKSNKTAVMPRDYKVKITSSGLIHITGGKWTTYRKMAEHTINKVVQMSGLQPSISQTKNLRIHGWANNLSKDHLSIYGTDANIIKQIAKDDPSLSGKIHSSYPYTKAEIKHVIKNEMAVFVEDVLARRIRLLFLDAKAAMDAAPLVVKMLASMNGCTEQWEKEQLELFNKLAKGYLPNL